jgi:hypothetical protein
MMKDEKYVTIKADDLDWLLQLAVIGSRIRQQDQRVQRVLLDGVDRLRAPDAPEPVSNGLSKADPAGASLNTRPQRS